MIELTGKEGIRTTGTKQTFSFRSALIVKAINRMEETQLKRKMAVGK